MDKEKHFLNETVTVKSWWHDDERLVKCQIIELNNKVKGPNSWYTVRPLEGNIHSRFIEFERIVG